MSCNTCINVHGCKEARVAHLCDSFEYTPLLASREALVTIVGESAAITALRKQKAMATPEHPNTTHIKDLVSTGNIEGLNALVENQDIQLPYLVMAASHLTGDSTKIGQMLRSQPDKRQALVDLLIQISQEVSSAEGANDAPPPVEEVVEEAPKTRKRRKRRTKAEIEAAKALKVTEEEGGLAKVAREVERRLGIAEPSANVDFDRAFNDILNAIAEAHKQQALTFEEALKRGFVQADQAQSTSLQRYEDVVDRLARLSSALVALEEQLMLTGMVLEPVVAKHFEG